ncbi:MAG: transglycosylase domain-containing protein [Propionibacteriaceae bacterium]
MPVTPKRAGSVVYSMVMFVVVSALAGVLVAGLFVPFAGVAGVGTRAVADELEHLPEELDTPPQAERSKVLLADGTLLANFYDENRVVVPLENIAPVMRQAQVAIEDHRFYEHGALDLRATLRALISNSAGGSTQGGSSLTQQYVKMVQIEKAYADGDEEGVAAAQETTYARKVQELRYAIALEDKLSKDEILERYLNIAYYGEGAYGVEAAARHYFGVSAKDLELYQASMLAGLVQNPDQVNPVANPAAALKRRNIVLNRMASPDLRIISQEEADKAKEKGFNDAKVTPTPNGCVGSQYAFLCDYVRHTLLQNKSLGKTREDREKMLKRGGLTIKTQIDSETQDAAEKAINEHIDPKDPAIGVMSMVEPGTGLILAMAQSRPDMGKKKGETFYNYAVSAELGGAEGYQAGSTFKVFTAAAALEKGIPLSKRYNATSPMNFSGQTFQSCEGPFNVGDWKVSNSTNTNGNMDMRRGTAMSVNTYYVQLEQDAGLCNTVKMAEKAGIELASDVDMVDTYQYVPSFTLGSAEVTPLSVAEAYATFAARGVHCNPIIVKEIVTKSGKKLKMPGADCKQVMEPEVADGMNELLQGVMAPGGTGGPATISGGYEQAGKTGTIDGNEAVWFAGYTPEVAGAAMIAVDKTNSYWKGRKRSLKQITLPESNTYMQGSGGGDAGQWIYKPSMEAALEGRPKTKFKDASDDIKNGKKVDVPSVSGLSPDEAKKKLEKAGFTVVRSNTYNDAPQGTYLGISPNGSVAEFSTITQLFSAGEDPAKKKAEEDKKKADEKEKKEKEKKEKDEKEKKEKKDDEKEKKKDKPGG